MLGSFWRIREGFLEEGTPGWDVRGAFCLVGEGKSSIAKRTAFCFCLSSCVLVGR